MMMIVAVIGFLAMAVFGIWLLVEAFKVSVGWGLISLLVPFGALVFAIKYWDRAKKPFLGSIAAGVIYMVGLVPTVMQNMQDMQTQAAQQQGELDEAQATDSAE